MPKTDKELIQERLANDEREVKAIRERANSEYRHESGEQYSSMLRDIRFLLGQLNIADEFWDSAERELTEMRECDKCDICEDHNAIED